MRRDQAGIVASAVVASASCIAVAGAPPAVTAAAGLALVAAPGYIWARALFGARLDRLPFLLVATGTALAVPAVGGVALSAAGVPLHRTAWVVLLATVALAGAVVAIARSRPEPAPGGPRRPARRLLGWQLAAFALAGVIAAGGAGLARAGAAIQPQPGFTQLWLLPPQHQAGPAIVGVRNHEGSAQRYRLVVTRAGRVAATWSVVLADGQTWRRSLRPAWRAAVGANLYLPGSTHPYRHVWLAAPRGGQAR